MTTIQSTTEAREEHGAQEKPTKWCAGATDKLAGVALAALFVWGGIAFFADLSGLVARIPVSDVNGWTIFFLGGGVIATVEILIRLVSTTCKRPQLINYIAVAFFFGVGLGVWWVFVGLALLGIGASIAREALRDRNGAPGSGPSR